MKKFKIIILLILIFVIGFAVGNTVKYYLDYWRADQNVKSFLNLLEAPYKNDAYGGKTPEETFDMYVSALKAGDLKLASKYFAVNKQEQKLESLKAIEDLDSYIKELETMDKNKWVKNINKNEATIEYDAHRFNSREIKTVNMQGEIIKERLPIGDYKSIMMFEKNKSNNIWKLYLL